MRWSPRLQVLSMSNRFTTVSLVMAAASESRIGKPLARHASLLRLLEPVTLGGVVTTLTTL